MGGPDVICIPEFTGSVMTGDSEMHVRTEVLKLFQVGVFIDRSALVEYGDVLVDEAKRRLYQQLEREVEKAGRLIVDSPVLQQSADYTRDCVWFSLRAKTRQSDVGEWASIWSAIREDGYA